MQLDKERLGELVGRQHGIYLEGQALHVLCRLFNDVQWMVIRLALAGIDRDMRDETRSLMHSGKSSDQILKEGAICF